MDVTYYLADALTGDIVPGVTLELTSPRFTRRMPGGPFTATMPINTLLDELHQFDFGYAQRLLDLIEPGTHTICPILNGVSVGEWLIWRVEPDDVAGTIELSGFEWGCYPQYRALERDYAYDGRDQGLIFYDLLVDCLRTGQTVQCHVPPDPVGATSSMDQKRKTAYYSAAIEQLGSIEWLIWSHPEWLDGVPTRMLRNAIVRKDSYRLVQEHQLIAASPGSPGGSLLSWKRTRDWAKAASSVFGFGRGQGDVQVTAERVIPANIGGGRLITTKYETFSEAEDVATLQALVDTAAAPAASPSEPVRARVNLDDFPIYPEPGMVFPVHLDPRPTFPGGHDGMWRVGETSIVLAGDRPVIDLLLEQIS